MYEIFIYFCKSTLKLSGNWSREKDIVSDAWISEVVKNAFKHVEHWVCCLMFLWCKEMFCFNETKFFWFKQNIFGSNKYWFESNKFLPWFKKIISLTYINALISLFWRQINLIQTNIYLVQRYFVWIKQILFHLNESFL